MQITMLQGKIHRATVTQAELDYVGSITVDEDLLDAAGIKEYQLVQIVDEIQVEVMASAMPVKEAVELCV